MTDIAPIWIWQTEALPKVIPIAGAAIMLAIAGLALAAMARLRAGLAEDAHRPVATALDTAGNPAARILIVGAGARGRELAEAMRRDPHLNCRIVGFVDDQPEIAAWDGVPILGVTRDIARIIEQQAVDEVIIAHDPTWQELLLRHLMTAGRDHHVRISSALTVRDAMVADARLRTIADIPLVSLNPGRPSALFRGAKRCFDVGFSLTALAISAPLILVAALLVKATSRGPAFFLQRRVGLRGAEFAIYKLRTMVMDAERETGPRLTDPYDARVTPVGRILRMTRLDELPQFVNVLKGEMSVVGPRPERPEFVSRFIKDVPGYAKRMAVKPGITGLAQVRGGYSTEVHTKLKYDWLYVCRQSAWLDLKILFHTIRVVLLCAGQ
jgi:exopolysaccharide biosynthesis polyprenyl glycosylphosphotransferase